MTTTKAERLAIVERNERRERLINDQLLAQANKHPGTIQTLYWVRRGSYGKEEETLCRYNPDSFRYLMKDLADQIYPLAIFTSRHEAITAALDLNDNLTFVVFERKFIPEWSIDTREVALVTDKQKRPNEAS